MEIGKLKTAKRDDIHSIFYRQAPNTDSDPANANANASSNANTGALVAVFFPFSSSE